MPPVVLKRRHSLKGKNIIPIVRKMKTTGRVTSFARMKSNICMEDMPRGELISAFRELTGEDEKEILEMAQKEATEANLRHLLHYAIIQANEVGQPAAQTLQRLETEDTVNEDREDEVPQTKKAKVSPTASATTTQTT
ncbi:uncharacterized protein LOC133189995 [Saccostrea echinata]|uniref:uncharacterized protein LOC133189995 n=1 Tax=Saccostrea echinata TaxID=191078 RepID=UPI002A80310B|nr:uncharacterized protein LOC133189995 [Saccostrea echinata]